jgi:hypothetical protein
MLKKKMLLTTLCACCVLAICGCSSADSMTEIEPSVPGEPSVVDRGGDVDDRQEIGLEIESGEEAFSGYELPMKAILTDLVGEEIIEFSWQIDGEVVQESRGNWFVLVQTVEQELELTVTVTASSESYVGNASKKITIKLPPLNDPLSSNFNFYLDPVIERGAFTFIDPGQVVYHDGQFHMFHNAIKDPNPIFLGYATSEDGLEWTKHSVDQAMLTYQDLAAVTGKPTARIHLTSVIYEDDHWTAYLTDVSATFFHGRILRATMTDPLGDWEISDTPILEADVGSWESGSIGVPHVFKQDNGEYVMYYHSRSDKVSRADSSDGIVWQKYKDASTDDATLLQSDPLITCGKPAVVQTSWGWILAAFEDLYISIDGLTWHHYAQPLYSREDLEERGIESQWITSLIIHDGTVYYYIEGGTSSSSDIYLATWDQ